MNRLTTRLAWAPPTLAVAVALGLPLAGAGADAPGAARPANLTD